MLLLRRSLPLVILLACAAIALMLAKSRTPPEKKPPAETLPLVEVMPIEPQAQQLTVHSYGVVQTKQRTQLVAEVAGRLVAITPQFVRGEWVQKGDLLAQIEPADYQADLIQAEAGLAQAKARLQEEIARGKVAEQEWRDVMNGPPPALGLRKPQLAQEQANVRSAEATLARAKRNLERTEIRAPFDGLIVARNVDLGQYLNVSTELGEVQGSQSAEIRLPVPPQELAYLEQIAGTPVTLSQSDSATTWQATLVRSEGIVNEDNRMVYLVAQVDDPYGRQQPRDYPLQFGSFVNAQIQGRTLENVVTLPRHVVRNQRVTVITSDNKVQLRPVTVVRSDETQVYIQGGLNRGERISLSAMDSLDQGRKVRVLNEPAGSNASASIKVAAGGGQ